MSISNSDLSIVASHII